MTNTEMAAELLARAEDAGRLRRALLAAATALQTTTTPQSARRELAAHAGVRVPGAARDSAQVIAEAQAILTSMQEDGSPEAMAEAWAAACTPLAPS